MDKKVYCFFCDKDVSYDKKNVENIYTVRGSDVCVKEEVFICSCCGNELVNANLNESFYLIYNEYLKLNGLSFEKLKEIRKFYNLSQELFASALNWSKKTVTRYENAMSLPQNQYISIYKSIENNKAEFLKILNSNRNKIDDKIYFKILDLIKLEIDIKTVNVFLYVLKDNYLTRTQIMKNLFAIDFESFKERGSSITNLKYAHGDYGPVIDKKDACLNFLIKHNYVEIVNNEEDYILFKPILECDNSLFSSEELNTMDKVLKKLRGKSSLELTNWSHSFKGWIDTKSGKQISYDYSKYFDLDKGW